MEKDFKIRKDNWKNSVFEQSHSVGKTDDFTIPLTKFAIMTWIRNHTMYIIV